MRGSFPILIGAALLALAVGGTQAQPGTAPSWDELTPQQRQALAPLRPQWPELGDARRQAWLEVATRMPTLPAEERLRLQARMAGWSKLTPAERGTARLQFQEAQRWTPQDRQARWQAYQSLHPEARRVLAERWKLEASSPAADGPRLTDGKRNVVQPPPPSISPARAASPTSVLSRSGATTQPMLESGTEPAHNQPGLPKVVATDAFVDPATLLPRRGPQGAAMAAPPAAQPAKPAR